MKILRICVSSIILILVVCLVYRNVTDYPFTNWDDIKYISQNPTLKNFDVDNVIRIFTPGAIPDEVIYIPFSYLSFLIEKSMFGLKPNVIHRSNLILHIFNVLLVFVLLFTIGRDSYPAGIGALIFAIHPIQVEAVVWCMGRKDLLSTFFALIAVLAFYIYSRDEDKKYYILSFLLLTFGLLTKPSLITLPLIFLLIDIYVYKSFKINRLWIFIPFFVLSVVCFGLNHMSSDQHSAAIFPLRFRIMCISFVIFGWAQRIVLLERPEPFYCWPDAVGNLPILHFGVCILIAGVVILLYWLFKKQRLLNGISFGLVFSAIAFLPAIGIIIDAREFMTADRYGYFPIVGILISFVSVFAGIRDRFIKPIISVMLSAWIVYGVFVTKSHISIWQSSISIWSHIIEKCPNLLTAYNNLGMAYIDDAKIEEGITIFKAGLNADPSYMPLYNNLGKIYFETGKLRDAKTLFHRALQFDADNEKILKNLGDVYRNLGNFSSAEYYYRNAIIKNGDYISAYLVLGDLYLKQRLLEAAEVMFMNVAELDPKNAKVYYNLGLLYESKGQVDDAITSYKTGIALNSGYWESYYNLGNIYFAKGLYQEAEGEYLKTLALNKEFVQAQINLGSVYLQLNRLDLAENVYLRALRIDSNEKVGIHYNLGLLYLKMDMQNVAVNHLQNSLFLDDDFGECHYELAKVYWQIGKYEEAFMHYNKAKAAGIIVDRQLLIQLTEKLKFSKKWETTKE